MKLLIEDINGYSITLEGEKESTAMVVGMTISKLMNCISTGQVMYIPEGENSTRQRIKSDEIDRIEIKL